ncbi:hypothetical protein [Paenibacillus pseudetheri]|uniref:Uncharacterized protein n=1 Tax=Paenibacillus pseudetheri TaxID=2897682 RepID=A0ABN8FR99_9BACL|nr:hypothetical protein [Paenibacillus pseudetheri]CAH1059567.1 hypothetical protein PAECIP111894_05779 [Paenibacillus pseudetheri]
MSVDDYLDLLNYAKAINDGQWQTDIIESLKNLNTESEEPQVQEESVIELWSQFDSVNILIMKLFEKLRKNEESDEVLHWKEQLLELKLERSILSKKILNRYIRIR